MSIIINIPETLRPVFCLFEKCLAVIYFRNKKNNSCHMKSSPTEFLSMIEERRNLKGENPLTYEKLIFRNGQPVCADDRIISVSVFELYQKNHCSDHKPYNNV